MCRDDDCHGAKERYGNRRGADVECEFRFHPAPANVDVPVPSETVAWCGRKVAKFVRRCAEIEATGTDSRDTIKERRPKGRPSFSVGSRALLDNYIRQDSKREAGKQKHDRGKNRVWILDRNA